MEAPPTAAPGEGLPPGEGPPASEGELARRLSRALALGGQLALVSFAYLLVAQSGFLDTATQTQNAFLPHATFELALGLVAGLLSGAPRPLDGGSLAGGSLVRIALLRSAITGVLVALATGSVLAFANEQIALDYRHWGACAAVAGLGTGLIAGPLCWVERLFERAPATWRRDLDAAVVAAGVAAAGLVLVSVEVAYLFAVTSGRGVVESLDAARALLASVADLPVSVAMRIGPYAVPFALLVVARLRRRDSGGETARETWFVVAGTAAVLGAWALVKAAAPGQLDYVTAIFVFFPLRRGAVLLVASALPLGCAAADAIESAWRRRDQQG